MSGTPGNTRIYSEFDVYACTDMAVALPANASASMPGGWGTPVGLLEGDSVMDFTRSRDDKPIFDANGNLIRTSRINFMEQVKFSVIEDNALTRLLINPLATSPAGYIGTPRPIPLKLALQATDGTSVYRLITANYAEIDPEGFQWDPKDVTKYPLVATIYPIISSKYRWIEQKVPTLVSIAITPLTLALTTGQTKQLVATGTYDDASTQVLTDVVTWSSSVPAKATVRFGDVTFVAAGATNISCSYLGVTSTANCVVTCS